MSLSDFINPWRAPGKQRPILYQPFIRVGDAVCLVGEKGSGKSTAACEIAFKSCCPPFPVILEPPTDPSLPPTLTFDFDNPYGGSELLFGGALQLLRDDIIGKSTVVLDAENDYLEWRNLLEETARHYGIDPSSHTFKAFTSDFKWRDGNEINWNDYELARAWMDDTLFPDLVAANCAILIVDSTHKLWTRDLNSPEWVSEGLGHMRKRCRQNSITLFCLTHTSRMYAEKLPQNKFLPRGSSQQENEFDVILGLERKYSDKLLKLHLVKRRAGKWCEEFTHATIALSPRHAGYGRLIESPWSYNDPRAVTVPSLTVAERNLLGKLSTTSHQMSEIPGNITRNKKTCEGLLTLNLAIKRGSPPLYSLTSKGIEVKSHL